MSEDAKVTAFDVLQSRLEQAAAESMKTAQEDGYRIDFVMILTVIETLVALVRNCPFLTPDQVKRPSAKPMVRLALRRVPQYLAMSLSHRNKYLNDVWGVIQDSTESEIRQFIQESRGDSEPPKEA